MHTPNALNEKTTERNSAESIPLFHVVTLSSHVHNISDPKYRREAQNADIVQKVRNILDEGVFHKTCEALCECGEKASFYLFLGHLYPLNGDNIDPSLELVDNRCFLMVYMKSLKNIELKGTPFDTGGIIRKKSELGKYVVDVLKRDKCQYIVEHSALNYNAVLAYASAYVAIFFSSTDNYVDRMFQKSDKEFTVAIDGIDIEHTIDARSIAFEVRCFENIAVPTKNETEVLVIADEIERCGNFPRKYWQKFNIQVHKSPIGFAYRKAIKQI
jgi:hypothetical protein